MALRETLRQGEGAVRIFTRNYDALPIIEGLGQSQYPQAGWHERRCVYFDAIEMIEQEVERMSAQEVWLCFTLESAATFGRGDGIPGLVDREVTTDGQSRLPLSAWAHAEGPAERVLRRSPLRTGSWRSRSCLGRGGRCSLRLARQHLRRRGQDACRPCAVAGSAARRHCRRSDAWPMDATMWSKPSLAFAARLPSTPMAHPTRIRCARCASSWLAQALRHC